MRAASHCLVAALAADRQAEHHSALSLGDTPDGMKFGGTVTAHLTDEFAHFAMLPSAMCRSGLSLTRKQRDQTGRRATIDFGNSVIGEAYQADAGIPELATFLLFATWR